MVSNLRSQHTATPYPTVDEYQNAVDRARAAAAAYYQTDRLIMDDATYDELVARITATETTNPSWGESQLSTVEAGTATNGDITHSEPMLSLDKAHHYDDITHWFTRLTDEDTVIIEAKLDGVALAARYTNGQLTHIVTRGDGISGEDITTNLTHDTIVGLPPTVIWTEPFEVRGECFLTSDQFTAANVQRAENGKPVFVNQRNAVAGTLRTQQRTQPVTLSFAAYSLHGTDHTSHIEQVRWLTDHGFTTAHRLTPGHQHTPLDQLTHIAEVRHQLGFDIDGAVLKVDRLDRRRQLGATGSHPKWAIAYKYQAEERTTVVTAIDVSPGRTGALVPRAELEPVFVAGTTITYATLHNFDIVAHLDVRVGDTVLVKRAGDVIPRIEGVLLDQRPQDSVPYTPPTVCPRCSSMIDRSDKRWRCSRGRLCGAAEQLVYAASRDALDIEGLGPAIVDTLIDAGLIEDVADLFTLTVDQLTGLDGIGATTAANLTAGIDLARQQPLHRHVTALGIRGTGRRLSKRLAQHFGTLSNLRFATIDELAAVEGVGDIKAQLIREELDALSDVIGRLVNAGINTVEPVTVPAAGQVWAGKKVVITGTIVGMSRQDAQQAAEHLGATVVGSVSKNTDIVVAGDAAGSKADKARQLGVTIIDATAFTALVAQHR